ncbi:bifunctional phosphopantothenoylcysteine decarboxylase/phosphopantothenate--cysteine ligase CoaBC [Thermodesulfobacteriota bacterium]
MLKSKHIVVGITGGIAAYKAAELVRLLVRDEAYARVAMTSNAARFVTPLTFEALSGNRVISSMWDREASSIDHITWGQESDLIIIAPATANFIGKMANGLADDFLSTMVLAATSKILVCPAMNTKMFENPAVQKNIDTLRKRKIIIMNPEEGQLACRTQGPGRLPEPGDILEAARAALTSKDLKGLKILVTAGPTEEPIDPVRHLTNRSSGKMGYALARAAGRRGASVILVSGPVSLVPPLDVNFVAVRTAEEMRKQVFDNRKECDIIIKAAAVSDYRPKKIAGHKIKKGENSISLELVKNPDILGELGSKKGQSSCLLIGFAAETEDILTNAREKLKRKNLDMIVANDVSRDDAGFETETNAVKIICNDEETYESPLMSKDEVADQILSKAKSLLKKKK